MTYPTRISFNNGCCPRDRIQSMLFRLICVTETVTTVTGGVVIIVMREEYLTYVKEYVDRLEPMMESFETRGLWKREERTVVPKYSFGKNGVVFVFRVLVSGDVNDVSICN